MQILCIGIYVLKSRFLNFTFSFSICWYYFIVALRCFDFCPWSGFTFILWRFGCYLVNITSCLSHLLRNGTGLISISREKSLKTLWKEGEGWTTNSMPSRSSHLKIWNILVEFSIACCTHNLRFSLMNAFDFHPISKMTELHIFFENNKQIRWTTILFQFPEIILIVINTVWLIIKRTTFGSPWSSSNCYNNYHFLASFNIPNSLNQRANCLILSILLLVLISPIISWQKTYIKGFGEISSLNRRLW